MENRLQEIFDFLINNRGYNHILQERYYRNIIAPFDKVADKVISLLYHIANTQSQPKIDTLAIFYKKVHIDIEKLESFNGFLRSIKTNGEITNDYNGLFQSMRKQSGWGDKTAALFVKSIYHLHNNKYSPELKIWNDVPIYISKDDDFYLPVDAVIISFLEK